MIVTKDHPLTEVATELMFEYFHRQKHTLEAGLVSRVEAGLSINSSNSVDRHGLFWPITNKEGSQITQLPKLHMRTVALYTRLLRMLLIHSHGNLSLRQGWIS